ncbi:hypothetical protein OIU76_019873 [Salix suchowensis]|nr:hypothetical protein OIU76_019873 [Salix suchowensis]
MGPSHVDDNPLQMVQRYFEGKNMEQLNINQLNQLERELDSILVYTRGRKTDAMMKSVSALHQKLAVTMKINGTENNTMIGFLTILALVLNIGLSKFLESEALFSIDGTQKYFHATPRSTNQTTYEQDLANENNLIEREISAIINSGNLASQHDLLAEDPGSAHPSPLDLFHF